MLKNISEKIKQEIEELSILLSDSDPEKMRRQIKAHTYGDCDGHHCGFAWIG